MLCPAPLPILRQLSGLVGGHDQFRHMVLQRRTFGAHQVVEPEGDAKGDIMSCMLEMDGNGLVVVYCLLPVDYESQVQMICQMQ